MNSIKCDIDPFYKIKGPTQRVNSFELKPSIIISLEISKEINGST
jgi:hypothetical protein